MAVSFFTRLRTDMGRQPILYNVQLTVFGASFLLYSSEMFKLGRWYQIWFLFLSSILIVSGIVLTASLQLVEISMHDLICCFAGRKLMMWAVISLDAKTSSIADRNDEFLLFLFWKKTERQNNTMAGEKSSYISEGTIYVLRFLPN